MEYVAPLMLHLEASYIEHRTSIVLALQVTANVLDSQGRTTERTITIWINDPNDLDKLAQDLHRLAAVLRQAQKSSES